MSIEAMKQALEALDKASHAMQVDIGIDEIENAITAIRKAIEEAEKQEPFAWIRDSGLEMLKLENGGHAIVYASSGMSNYSMPLYTHPPKREWIGLTDYHKQNLLRESVNNELMSEEEYECYKRGIFDAEAKLKELNT
jgi:hypothetical protein